MEEILQLLILGLSLGLTYVLMSLGITMIFSIMGIVNFAHGEIYMVGAFGTYVLVKALHLNFYVSIVASMFIVLLLGLIVERFLIRAFRSQHLNGLVLTIGLSIFLQNLALIIFGAEDHSFSSPLSGEMVSFAGVTMSLEKLVAMAVSAVSLFLIYLFIKRTSTGQAMQAVAQDGEASALQGININFISATAFAVGCVLAGLAGALLSSIYVVSPYIGGLPVFKAFVVVVLGGLGSIVGALLGGLILGFIDSICLYYLGSLGDLLGFVILIIFICIKPTGIWGYEIK